MKIYYEIWADGLIRLKSRPENKEFWKVYGMVFMTLSMSINFLVIITLIEKHVIGFDFYDIDTSVISNDKLSSLVSFLLQYALPCFLINYFLIFYKDRYLKIMKESKNGSGKLFLTYFISSLALPFVLLLIGFLFFME